MKTHRAACAIDDIINDSKQALSMISWMAARREREEDKDTNRIGFFHVISPDLRGGNRKGFALWRRPGPVLHRFTKLVLVHSPKIMGRPGPVLHRFTTLVLVRSPKIMGRKGNRKSANQKEKQRDDNRKRISEFCNRKADEQAAKDSVAREQALTKLGVREKFNFEDHKEIYNYSAEAVEAPIETVDGSIPPPEVTYETLDEGRLPQAPTEEPSIILRLKPLGSKLALRFMRSKKIMQMHFPKVK